MNLDNSSQNEKLPEIRRAIDQVCREFEARWRKDPDYRLEQILPEIPQIVEPVPVDLNQAEVVESIVAELIRVEMDLRFEAKQQFDPFEYIFRLPDFGTVINQSFERLKQLDTENSLDLQTVATISMGAAGQNDEAGDLGDWTVDQSGNCRLPSELGPFTQIAKIDAGGFGVVCRAVDSRDGRAVALKFPRKQILTNDLLLKLFLDEALRAMELDHPGIVKTLSVEQIEGYLAIVQQLIVGTDLKKTIKDPRTHREIAQLIAAIADALAYANRQGIVHRDLKPSNILLDESGRPYIADFGMALHESVQLDSPNERCGTPPYMSPQLVAGLTKNLDGRTDIWSLGVILYELLAGKRPFRGNTVEDIYRQIESRDPRPLREIDNSIDRELERICLKCLARQARDRYLTADDLADDLRHWIGSSGQPTTVDSSAVFVPKGLRSYSAEDSQFFLELLPGPRDRNDIPASIRFWSVRICEPVAAENRVAVGVIYGPSGSGKSSFVKAGLIPQVKQHVDAIYVEATQADTEVRLIKALRDRYPEIPQDVSLPDIFAGLNAGRWRPSADKILMVLDQFEQRLSQADEYSQSQLAKALRHCDGERLQCLLLVRDDFWLALTRFVDALEMDLLEGQNSQAIDLFDREHAKKVLIKLGRAYDRLPDETVELSQEQHEFLEETIDQLAVGNYVICVRLTLFAEMFKARPWARSELQSVGGVHGVGEKFLESTFGSESTSRRYQSLKDSVQAVLKALLPESGSDIRGAMRSEEELLVAAEYENQPDKFKSLIKTLDQDLRLITRTDPNISGEASVDEKSERTPTRYYQLTHDYLVPSIRDWLTAELRKYRRGRAILRLRELASQVIPGQKPKYLPTNFEWLTWQWYLRNERLTEKEQAVMRSARRQFLASFGVAVTLLAILITITSVLAINDRRYTNAKNLVDTDLIGRPYDRLGDTIDQLKDYKSLVLPRLRQKETESEFGTDNRRRVLLGLLQLETEPNAQKIGDEITENIMRHDCGPSELEASVNILKSYSMDCQDRFLKRLDDGSADPRSRFRAAVSLALLNSEQVQWKKRSGLLGSTLIREPVATHVEWIELLTQIGESIGEDFTQLFLSTEERGSALALATAVFAFTKNRDPEKCAAFFAELVHHSNAAQFDAIFSVYEQNADQGGSGKLVSDFAKQLEEKINRATDPLVKTQLSIGLFRLGKDKFFVDALSNESNGLGRALAINLANPGRITLHSLRRLYERRGVGDSDDTIFKRSVLLTLAVHAPQTFDQGLRDWLTTIATDHYLHDQDAGSFSAAESILRRLGNNSIMDLRARRREKLSHAGIRGDIFINSQLQSFSILETVDTNGKVARFGISTTEVTKRDMQEFLIAEGLANQSDEVTNPDHPYKVYDFLLVCRYCNWLSDQDEILPYQWCYPTDMTPADLMITAANIERTGYRIPTLGEWNTACDSNRVFDQFQGDMDYLAMSYAWIIHNAHGSEQDVASLLPNDDGLFDSFGNLQEICQFTDENQLLFYERGHNARYSRRSLSLDAESRTLNLRNPTTYNLVGFRPVCALP